MNNHFDDDLDEPFTPRSAPGYTNWERNGLNREWTAIVQRLRLRPEDDEYGRELERLIEKVRRRG